jgi:hypothetical protein
MPEKTGKRRRVSGPAVPRLYTPMMRLANESRFCCGAPLDSNTVCQELDRAVGSKRWLCGTAATCRMSGFCSQLPLLEGHASCGIGESEGTCVIYQLYEKWREVF